jgi:phosphatidylglycerol:prolipoprotein diacylglycerol transferase
MAESIIEVLTDYWFWGAVGFILGSSLGLRNLVKTGVSFPKAVIGVTASIYTGIVGTRVLWMLIFNPHMFRENLPFALAFWQGTGTWLAVPIAGALGASIVLIIVRKPVWTNLGSYSPGLALAHAITRVGCLFAGCCYGSPTSVLWAIYSKRLNAMVHPTQIYSMVGEIIAFVILQLLWKRPHYRKYLWPGYGMLLATHRFISEFFRGGDPGPEIISGLSVYQTICIFLFVGSLGVILILRLRKLGIVIAIVLAVVTASSVIAFRPGPRQQSRAVEGSPKLYTVITRDLFVNQLADWKVEREKEGFLVMMRAWEVAPSAIEIRNWITAQDHAASVPLGYILIVGDCAADQDQTAQWHIPSVKRVFQVNGQSIEFVADSLYGDLDGDSCPDVPVGRLPVQDAIQLETQIAKVLNYDHQIPTSASYRTVIWAGAKGYNTQMQQVAHSLTTAAPGWIDCLFINGHPLKQPSEFLEQISRPTFLSLVASHGSFRSITIAEYEGEAVFLSVEDLTKITSITPSGPLFLLGCDSGRFNMPQLSGPSLAEAFTAHPGGQICVVSATGSTNPLTNYFITKAMIERISEKPEAIGNFVLEIQRRLSRQGGQTLLQLAQEDGLARQFLQAVPDNERASLEVPELLRREVLMYNLIGDPACRLKSPTTKSVWR